MRGEQKSNFDIKLQIHFIKTSCSIKSTWKSLTVMEQLAFTHLSAEKLD